MKNWQYVTTNHREFPHSITFNRCSETGLFTFVGLDKFGASVPAHWQLNANVREWLDHSVGTNNYLHTPYVSYAVNFRHQRDAMLFKLAFSNGVV